MHARRDAIYCSVQCRKRAFRFRQWFPAGVPPAARPGLRFVYADPPYEGKAWMYEDHPDYGGEVDHVELIAGLERRRLAGEIHGWALSCSKRSLRRLLPLCPQEADWGPWVKPTPIRPGSAGPQNRTECIVWVGGRACVPGVPDALVHDAARDKTSDLVGRKPPAYIAWLVQLLGLRPGDQLEDMFPGTGQVGRAWLDISQRAFTIDAGRLPAGVPGRPGTLESGVDVGRVPAGPRTAESSRAAAARVPPRGGTRVLLRSRTQRVPGDVGTAGVSPAGGTRPAWPADAFAGPQGRVPVASRTDAGELQAGRVPDVHGTATPRRAAPEAPQGPTPRATASNVPVIEQAS